MVSWKSYKKEVILEAQRDKKESPLCHIDGHVPSQKCRVVLSASQMTAAKNWMLLKDYHVVMDKQLMQYLPAQVKLEDAPRLLKFPSENVQTYGFDSHDTNGQNNVRKLKILWYLLNESVIH